MIESLWKSSLLPVTGEGLLLDPRFDAGVDGVPLDSTGSVLAVPITARSGLVLGVLQVARTRVDPFSAEDTELITVLARLSASVRVIDAICC